MKLFLIFFIGTFIVGISSVGTGTAYASYTDHPSYDSIFDRIEMHLERARERVEEAKERLGRHLERIDEQVMRHEEQICRQLEQMGLPANPSFCDGEEPEPEPEAPMLTFEADPLSVMEGATSTLIWDSEHADDCEASDGWLGTKTLDGSEIVVVLATTTYSLTCTGEGGTTTESATVTVFEDEGEPEPSVDHLLISEVLYDVAGDTQGEEPDNEWVEIYNPTDAAVDLMDWMIGESATSSDIISTSSHMLGAGDYLLITDATTTDDFWGLDLVDVIYLGSPIGNGLANGGDHVALFDAGDTIVDDVSYGTNEIAFSPSVPDVAEGHSIVRSPVDVDTDSASDWTDSDTPTPGS